MARQSGTGKDFNVALKASMDISAVNEAGARLVSTCKKAASASEKELDKISKAFEKNLNKSIAAEKREKVKEAKEALKQARKVITEQEKYDRDYFRGHLENKRRNLKESIAYQRDYFRGHEENRRRDVKAAEKAEKEKQKQIKETAKAQERAAAKMRSQHQAAIKGIGNSLRSLKTSLLGVSMSFLGMGMGLAQFQQKLQQLAQWAMTFGGQSGKESMEINNAIANMMKSRKGTSREGAIAQLQNELNAILNETNKYKKDAMLEGLGARYQFDASSVLSAYEANPAILQGAQRQEKMWLQVNEIMARVFEKLQPVAEQIIIILEKMSKTKAFDDLLKKAIEWLKWIGSINTDILVKTTAGIVIGGLIAQIVTLVGSLAMLAAEVINVATTITTMVFQIKAARATAGLGGIISKSGLPEGFARITGSRGNMILSPYELSILSSNRHVGTGSASNERMNLLNRVIGTTGLSNPELMSQVNPLRNNLAHGQPIPTVKLTKMESFKKWATTPNFTQMFTPGLLSGAAGAIGKGLMVGLTALSWAGLVLPLIGVIADAAKAAWSGKSNIYSETFNAITGGIMVDALAWITKIGDATIDMFQNIWNRIIEFFTGKKPAGHFGGDYNEGVVTTQRIQMGLPAKGGFSSTGPRPATVPIVDNNNMERIRMIQQYGQQGNRSL